MKRPRREPVLAGEDARDAWAARAAPSEWLLYLILVLLLGGAAVASLYLS